MFYNAPLEISKEVWSQILTHREVTTESDLNILKIVYESKNHEIRASEIASRSNIPHHGVINLQISRFSKRVIHKTGVQPLTVNNCLRNAPLNRRKIIDIFMWG